MACAGKCVKKKKKKKKEDVREERLPVADSFVALISVRWRNLRNATSLSVHDLSPAKYSSHVPYASMERALCTSVTK